MPHWNEYNIGYRPAFWFGEHSGVMAGTRLEGRYLFNTKRLNASFMLTSGNINQTPLGNALDVDYTFSFRDRWRFLGPEGWWYASAERFYGINRERIGIEKQLGRYGRLERQRRVFSLEVVHINKTAERTVSFIRNEWQRGNLTGINGSFEVGDATQNGILFTSSLAVFKATEAAHQVGLLANRTYTNRKSTFSTRFGIEIAGGARTMATQQQFNLAYGTALERWENKTWFSFANLSEDVIDKTHLVFDTGNALSVYALTGSKKAQLSGNNMISASIWNMYKPMSQGVFRPLRIEIYAGAGKAWNGSFNLDELLGLFDHKDNNTMLASVGTGVSFPFKELRSKWIAQSTFLEGLVISIRTPLYVHAPQKGGEFEARFLFGLSQRF